MASVLAGILLLPRRRISRGISARIISFVVSAGGFKVIIPIRRILALVAVFIFIALMYLIGQGGR
jgi:hypothetical protein